MLYLLIIKGKTNASSGVVDLCYFYVCFDWFTTDIIITKLSFIAYSIKSSDFWFKNAVTKDVPVLGVFRITLMACFDLF